MGLHQQLQPRIPHPELPVVLSTRSSPSTLAVSHQGRRWRPEAGVGRSSRLPWGQGETPVGSIAALGAGASFLLQKPSPEGLQLGDSSPSATARPSHSSARSQKKCSGAEQAAQGQLLESCTQGKGESRTKPSRVVFPTAASNSWAALVSPSRAPLINKCSPASLGGKPTLGVGA